MRTREERGPLGWLDPNGSMVKALILANVAVFLLDMLSNRNLTNLLLLHPWYVRQFQLWRLVTYQFAHGGFLHLLFNMYGLWLFGRGVEQILGQRRFLQLYLFSGIVGAGLWLLANWWGGGMAVIVEESGAMGRYLYKSLEQLDLVLKDHPDYRLVSVYGGCVGASGALFGVMAAAAMAFPNAVISLLFPPISLRMKTFIWVYALLEVVMAFDSHSNVAHLAHLGGMVGAFIYMRRLRRGQQFSVLEWFKSRFSGFGRRSRRHGPDMDFPKMDGGPTSEEVDRVLEKMSQEGYEKLTDAEKRTLEAASQRLRRQ
jgi:membrane associated rhomboid family serine protease